MKKKVSIVLIDALSRGRQALNEDSCELLNRKIISFESSEGGFHNGRTPDVYYTAFGLILAYICRLKIDISKHKNFIDSVSIAENDLINQLAMIRAKIMTQVFRVPHAFKKIIKWHIRPFFSHYQLPDIKSIETMYDAFLYMCILQDMSKSVEPVRDVFSNLFDLRNPDGGFPNHKGELSNVNATVSYIIINYYINNEIDEIAFEFLQSMQDESGGFRASKNAAIPDILSTAVALTASYICSWSLPEHLSKKTDKFISAHWLNNGGFSATLLDNTTDPEYIFYGLLAVGMKQ